MVAVALALAASGCWGLADFGGGLTSRRVAVPVVLLVVELGGLVTAGAILAGSGAPWPGAGPAAYALGAGAAGIAGLGLFYRALAIGTMSVVAPITSTGAILPVVFGLARGDTLGALTGAGIVLALSGVALASREQGGPAARPEAARTALALALLAAVGVGTFFILYEHATTNGTAWPILLSRLPALPLVGAVVLARRPAPPAPRQLGVLMVLGQLDCGATALYASALTRGELGVVSVLGSLYPVVTVLLARAVLGERLAPVQGTGVAAALAGVALVSLGTA